MKGSLHMVNQFPGSLVWDWTKAQLKPLPSKGGAQRKNELVLEMFSVGDLLDSLWELPGSLADVPGSVDNNSS